MQVYRPGVGYVNPAYENLLESRNFGEQKDFENKQLYFDVKTLIFSTKL